MQYFTNRIDARWFQVIFQAYFLFYGIYYLGWTAEWQNFAIYIGTALATQWAADSIIARRFLPIGGKKSFLFNGGLSALISAASLCLLLKTNEAYICFLAAFISIASKYVLRINGKHVFNPSALGIVAVISFTNDAWLSPAQWGSNTVVFFMVVTLGLIVITRVQKLDVCLAFLFSFLGLMFIRQVIYLNWPLDHFWHTMGTGSLLLFTFFMISDPKTAPNHKAARIIWGVAIGALSFWLTAFKFINAAPIKVLVLLAPLVPVLDSIFKSRHFNWSDSLPFNKQFFSILKFKSMQFKKITSLFFILTMLAQQAYPFCGFYVAKADGTLKNKTSQVILVRDGNKNVITMYNDFKGNLKDFAMVVPVPVVLKQSDIKVVDQYIFDRLNDNALKKQGIRNWFWMTFISLAASALFFLISPFDNNTNALAGFKRASIFDILLAFFGGMAGFIGIIKKEGTKVIAGVAVATACMPPLCTAGFGLAHADWELFIGGLYFYLINCLFIGLATFFLARFAGYHLKKDCKPFKQTANWLWTIFIIAMLIPSIYIAYIRWSEERTKAAVKSDKERIELLEKRVFELDSLFKIKK